MDTTRAEQVFVITSMSRADLAAALNDYLDAVEAPGDRLAPDDERLTDTVCLNYCASLGGLDGDDTEQDQDEYLACLIYRTLEAVGIAPPASENSEETFRDAYRELANQSKCDAYGGAESERVHREWLAAGRPDPRLFIVERANALPYG